MGLWVPNGFGDFEFRAGNTLASRPSGTPGTSVATGTGVYGAYSTLIAAAAVTSDVYGVMVCLNNTALTTVSRVATVKIGVDPAGGTTFITLIPDLVAWSAGPLTTGGGMWYYFPIFIKAGSTIGAAALGIGANTINVQCIVFGRPRAPSKPWVGTAVDVIGPLTPMTSGTTSDGTYAALGTTTKAYKYWQCGMGCDTTAGTSGNVYTMDLAYGDASNKMLIIADQMFQYTTAAETFGGVGTPSNVCYRRTPSGAIIYARIQCSGTADASIVGYAYGCR